MTAITKPRARRAESATADDIAIHYWLGRLSMCLALAAADLPDGGYRQHVRAMLAEFVESGVASPTLAREIGKEIG